MLSSRAGRSAARLLPKSTWARWSRVEQHAGQNKRVAAAYSTTPSTISMSKAHGFLRVTPVGPSQAIRTVSTRTASKPKAHTGKTTTKSRAKKSEGESPKKKTTSSKAKSKTRAESRPKKKLQKPLSEEEKKKKVIRELRNVALKTPKRLPDNAFLVINTEIAKERHALTPTAAKVKLDSLSPEAREHYNHLANENKVKNNAAYKSWVESYAPEEIRKANLARNSLRRLDITGFPKIQDERQVKRPLLAHSIFLRDRYSSGEMRGITFAEAATIIFREWKELPEAEKRVYYAQQEEMRAQYVQEVKRVYGHDTVLGKDSKAAAAVAA